MSPVPTHRRSGCGRRCPLPGSPCRQTSSAVGQVGPESPIRSAAEPGRGGGRGSLRWPGNSRTVPDDLLRVAVGPSTPGLRLRLPCGSGDSKPRTRNRDLDPYPNPHLTLAPGRPPGPPETVGVCHQVSPVAGRCGLTCVGGCGAFGCVAGLGALPCVSEYGPLPCVGGRVGVVPTDVVAGGGSRRSSWRRRRRYRSRRRAARTMPDQGPASQVSPDHRASPPSRPPPPQVISTTCHLADGKRTSATIKRPRHGIPNNPKYPAQSKNASSGRYVSIAGKSAMATLAARHAWNESECSNDVQT